MPKYLYQLLYPGQGQSWEHWVWGGREYMLDEIPVFHRTSCKHTHPHSHTCSHPRANDLSQSTYWHVFGWLEETGQHPHGHPYGRRENINRDSIQTATWDQAWTRQPGSGAVRRQHCNYTVNKICKVTRKNISNVTFFKHRHSFSKKCIIFCNSKTTMQIIQLTTIHEINDNDQ